MRRASQFITHNGFRLTVMTCIAALCCSGAQAQTVTVDIDDVPQAVGNTYTIYTPGAFVPSLIPLTVEATASSSGDPVVNVALGLDGELTGSNSWAGAATAGTSFDNVDNVYDPWNVDIDEDKVKEHIRWDRKPLEAIFSIGPGANAQRIRLIDIHSKSKGIFDIVDLARFQEISYGNRKKLIAQATRLRQRMDELLAEPNAIPTIVLGDMNDGPGLDAFEQRLGRSFVETTMGNVFNPANIFRNALQHIPDDFRWTADFPDPIVNNPRGFNHRVWIDHILVSPDLADPQGPIRLVANSGAIDENDDTAELASDHFAVSCVLTDDPP